MLTDRQPSGVLKVLLRAPIWLYRAKLGRLLGRRFVYIAHRGRRTGVRREVVVEVVRFSPDVPEAVVIAAWGKNPDWYRNLQAAPALEVRIGAERWEQPLQRFLDSDEAARAVSHYQGEHPAAWKRVAPVLGLPADPADPRWSELVRDVRAIGFSPSPDGG